MSDEHKPARTDGYSRLHVLLSAYACSPLRGSEEAVGWNWVQAAARSHRATVLTAAFHEADIAAACDPTANPRFVFVPHRPWHYAPTTVWRTIEGSIAKPLMNVAYAQWQRDAFRVARALATSQRFDLVHQLTYVGFRFPGHLWRLGLPFVWGPVGGLEDTPWRLLPAMGPRGVLYYAGRNTINAAQRRWLSTPRHAAAAASPGLIAATESIARALKRTYGADSTVISEVVAPVEMSPPAPRGRHPGEPLRLVWSGLHLPGKALNLLLEAMAGIGARAPIALHILGDGPKRRAWMSQARRLGVDSRCVWHGSVTRSEALRLMSEAHVLVITSLKDLTSTVLLEGLALGLPVVCPDHCGFSNVATEACGIKVAPESVRSLVAGFRSAILRLEADEEARLRMAAAALERARAFSHEALQSKLQAVYRAVLAASQPESLPVA